MTLKKYLHIFFFVTLIFFKVAAVQVYLHHEVCDSHEDDCELCEYVIQHQGLEFTTPSFFQAAEAAPPFTRCIWENHYKSIYVSAPFTATLFSRPPPPLS